MEISQECYRSRERFVDQILKGFASGSVVRNLPAKARDTEDAGDLDLIPGSGRSPGAGNGNPLQYPCLRGAWQATGHRVAVRYDLVTSTATTIN